MHFELDIVEVVALFLQTCGMLACHNHWHWALYYIEIVSVILAEQIVNATLCVIQEKGSAASSLANKILV